MTNIIGTLPDTLTNGTTADASQVMANLTFIANQVNANAMPADVEALPDVTSIGPLTGLQLNEPGNSIGTLTINSPNDAQGACITFIGNGASTPKKYIQVFEGKFMITNSGITANILQLDDAGDLSVTGSMTAAGTVSGSNITGTSDERLKKDWEPIPADFIENLASLKSGTYTRIDNGERQAGVSAQGLRKFLPESVVGDDILSVAYGHAALVACVELAKEVMRLRALLEPVK